MAGLADYLAKNYLTADSKEKKSKKRKRKENAGLTIADDDSTGWERANANKDNEDRPTIVAGRTTEFRKSKVNNFVSLGDAVETPDAEQDAADKILASAAAERDAQRAADDEAPQVVVDDADEGTEAGKKMQSGANAGLQTAAQVAEAVERKRARELRKAREAERERVAAEGGGAGGGETIYRDATGRIINVAMKRAEARKQAEDEERKKREEAEAAKGDVQRAAKMKRREDLEDAKFMTVARYADDKELNDEMKERDRWNDPAAGFVEKKSKGKSVTGRPLYQGPAAPNRYGIRPGWRWDGVDRSSGFEKQWFAARNKQANRRDLEYAWQMDE